MSRRWLSKLAAVARVNAGMLLDKLAGRKVIILDLEEAILLPFLQPVVDHLRRMSGRLAFYAAYKTTCPAIGDLALPARRVFHYQLSRHMAAADLFLSPHVWGNAARRVLKVHLPHGHPVKFACLPKEPFERFDVHLVTGPLHREQTEYTIAHHGIKKEIRLLDAGLPKSDKLMNGHYDRAAVLRGLGLDPARQTVIYAPSWEEGLSLRAFRERLLDQLAAVAEANVIIKLHPASCVPREHPEFELYTGGVNWTEVADTYGRLPRVRHVVTNDVDPLLAASDLMVTDISGVALEFLLLGRPVIYVDCPDYFTKTMPRLYASYGSNTADYIKNDPKSNAGRHVGHVVDRIEDLAAAVRHGLANPDDRLAERQAFARSIRYHPGRAGEIAAGMILDLLGLPKEPRPKPGMDRIGPGGEQ